MKRLFSIFLSLTIISTIFCTAPVVYSATTSVKLGDNITAVYDSTALTLKVTGSGDMYDFDAQTSPFKDNTVYKFTSASIGEGIKYIGNFTFANNQSVASVTFPSTLVGIGERAFSGCKAITSFSVPKSVRSIGSNAFCTGVETMKGFLTEIKVDPENQYYCDIDGVLYDKALTTLIKVPSSYAGDELILPSTVTTISEYASVKCLNLTRVEIPRACSVISDYAFSACKNLKQATIENPSRSMTISKSAFITREYDASRGTYYEVLINNNLVFYGYEDSAVEVYADGIGAGFEALNCEHNYKIISETASSCTELGSRSYACEICNKTYGENIPLIAHTYNNVVTPATASKAGSVVAVCTVCNGEGTKTSIPQIKTISLEATNLIYNGKVRSPRVIVKDTKGKTLVKNTDYTLSYASGRKNVGKYSVKITFKGNYSGTKTLYFTINPKNTSISKLTAGSKKFTVKLKKYTTQTTGYQIQYATNSSFKSAKTVTLKNTTTSKTVKSLKAKKKYYVRVRTYKTVGSTKYYSSWSKAKTVKTK